MNFPIEFQKCPNCGCKDTICRQAMADEPSLSQGPPPPVDIKVTSLQKLVGLSTPTIKVLLRHYDTCAKCGQDRCVKVETTTIPTDVFMKMMGMGVMMGKKS